MENMFEITTYESGVHSTSDRARLNQSFPKGATPQVNLQRPASEMRDQLQTYWKENLQEGRFPEDSDFYQTPVGVGETDGRGSYEYDGFGNLRGTIDEARQRVAGARAGTTVSLNSLGPNTIPVDNFHGSVPDDHPVATTTRTSATPFVSLGKDREQATQRNVSVKMTDDHRMGSAGLTDE